MSFAETTVKLLIEYKNLLKKHLTAKERALKLKKLGLNSSLRTRNEIQLYYKMQEVIADLETWLNDKQHAASWYSGIDEFLYHVKQIFASYQIEGTKIIHTKQVASSALVEAIQIISFNNGSLKSHQIDRLNKCYSNITRYGSAEQQLALNNALQKYTQKELGFPSSNPQILFQTLPNRAQTCLEEY